MHRVATGFWRRGAEAPSAVKLEDRITEILQGSWSYVAGPTGRAPGMLSCWSDNWPIFFFFLVANEVVAVLKFPLISNLHFWFSPCCLLSRTGKLVGTATPKESLQEHKTSWSLSTGSELIISWDSSSSVSNLSFHLIDEMDNDASSVKWNISNQG